MKNARAISLMALFALSGLAHAAWPEKPVKLVVPYPAGGSVDMIARQYAEYLGKEINQSVIVENKGGASTNIGTSYASKSKPDGYTILLGTESLAHNTALGPNPGFDVVNDLAPISMLTRIPSLVAAHPSVPVQGPQQLVKLSNEDPGKLAIGSASLHLQIASLEKSTGLTLTHVPYKGGAQAAADAMGNQVNFVLASIPVLHPLVTTGKLQAVAITGDERSPALPDVPTFKEQGFSEAVFSSWYAVFAPKGTPPEVVARINQVTHQFVRDSAAKKKLEGIGYTLVASTASQLSAQLKRDIQLSQKFAAVKTAQAK